MIPALLISLALSGQALSPPVGGASGGGLPLVGGAMTGDILFSGATNGTCFEDAEQCIDSDGAGGFQFMDEAGNVILTLSTAGVVTPTGAFNFSNSNTYAADDITDADVVDTITASNYALLAGGNTFASSNTYAADDITDADVVDTITASNYALLAGGNTFASSNTYAADDITDADVVDTITASLYALLSGGNTFASSNTYAANDITDADVVDTITASNYALLAGGNTFASSNTYAADDITDADVVDTLTASSYVLITSAASSAGQNSKALSGANAAGEYGFVAGTTAALSGASLATPVFAAGHTLGGTPAYTFTVDGNGHTTVIGSAGNTVIGVGTCTSESLTSGDDMHGQVLTTCTLGQTTVVTFGLLYNTAPYCVVSAVDAAGATQIMAASATTSAITMTAGGVTTAGSYNYICVE